MADTVDRQAAIDALDGNIIVTSEEIAQAVMDYIRGCADRIRSLPSEQPELSLEQVLEYCRSRCITAVEDEVLYKRLDSAYAEGYTAAESKYRKMWDEMQATIKEKAFGKRKGLIHTADIDAMPTIEERKTGKWERHNTYHGDDVSGFVDPDWRCSECGRQANFNAWCMYDLTDFCPNCGARLVQEGEDNDS